MKKLIEIQNFSVSYETGKQTLKDISLSVFPGEIIAIVGGSGSGKSTLLKSLIGLFSDGSADLCGSILYEGNDLLKLREREWNQIRGTEISLIFQNSEASLNPNRKIKSQLLEYASEHGRKDSSDVMQEMETLLKELQISDPGRILEAYPSQLSGGMLQRTAIAMSVLFRPKLILADEPTSALDVTIQAQVVKQIRAIRDRFGSSVIFVTHNMAVASYIADRIVVMQNGRIIESGTREEIIFHSKTEYTKKLLLAVTGDYE